MDDPISRRITLLQMKIADLKVDHARALNILENLINSRSRATARQAIIDGAIQGITEAIAERD